MITFKGEDKINCRLIDGKCQDWNFMTLRDKGKGEVKIMEFQSNGENPEFDATIVYSLSDDTLVTDLGTGKNISMEKGNAFEITKKPFKQFLMMRGGPVIAATFRPF